MSENPVLALSDVVELLDARFPQATAEAWDAVGLVVGDPGQPVHKVMFAVDPVAGVIEEALDWGADLLITHHPLLLKPVHGVAATTFKGRAVHRLIEGGCALFVAHTNADVARGGVADALAELLGVTACTPLVPADDNASIGLGRVGRLRAPTTLGDFAQFVAEQLPATAQGIRVAGDVTAQVEKVALVGGSGESLFDDVLASGADVYLTSDLKHHPVSELREHVEPGTTPGSGGRPFLIDTAHFASEWPWLPVAAEQLRSDVAARGTTVEVRVSTLRTDPWTAHLASASAAAPTELEKGSAP